MNSGFADRVLGVVVAGIAAAYLSSVAWLTEIFIASMISNPGGADPMIFLVAIGGIWLLAGAGAVFGMVGATLLLAVAVVVVERLPVGWTHRVASMTAGAAAGVMFVVLAHLPDVQFVYSSRHVLGVWFLRMFLGQGPVTASLASLVPPLAGMVAGLAYNGIAPRPGRGPFRTNLAAGPPSP